MHRRSYNLPGTRSQRHLQAFTLVEVMVSLAASVGVLGALLVSSMSLQKTLHHSETSATAYSDQHRLTDYIGRDLRRAVGLAFTDAAGFRSAVSRAAVDITIADRATLIISLPAYYRSNLRYDAQYDAPLEVVGTAERLDYGTSTDGQAPPVEVSYRRLFYSPANCVCYLRQEAGADEVIVRDAETLSAQVLVEEGAQTIGIKTWTRSRVLGLGKPIYTFDRLLMRNPPLDFRP